MKWEFVLLGIVIGIVIGSTAMKTIITPPCKVHSKYKVKPFNQVFREHHKMGATLYP